MEWNRSCGKGQKAVDLLVAEEEEEKTEKGVKDISQ